MSNILKVTTPISGYENQVNKQTPVQPQDMSIKNPVDPSRIIRPDRKQQANGEQTQQRGQQGISTSSNYGNFIQSLRSLPTLRETMTTLIYSGMGNLVESGISAGTAEEIQALLEMLNLNQEELKAFLKGEMNGANRMQGGMFDALRQVLADAKTVELKAGVLDFLRKYNDMSSAEHILKNIRGSISDMEGYMFSKDREGLHGLAQGLQDHSPFTEQQNLQLLKGKIIPYLGNYVSSTRDMGKIRDLINLLGYNTARYENGTMDSITQAFRRLNNFPTFNKYFGGMSPEDFRTMMSQVDFERAAGKANWNDKFLNILRAGVQGEAGLENKEAFMNIMNSMLVNESVYMPMNHVMLPMILNGVPMYSEMWVDPDEESGNAESDEKGIKLLIKLDMKDVGFFDMMFYYEKGRMSMSIQYPENLAEHEADIRKNILEIMKKNNLQTDFLAVEKGKKPIEVSAAFPKIFERRNTINVTV